MSLSGLGVIASAGLELHPGLTVLTGETGAGKTMVLTGLHLLSGARADPSRVRTDARRAVVEGRFVLAGAGGAQAAAVAEQAGGEADEDGSFIASRTVGADGRSRAHLGGRSVPAGVLAEFTEPLLAVHGQNDQLRLQRPAEQRAALDRSAEATVAPLLARYRDLRTRWQAAVAELTERTTRARELAREADQLGASLAEIDEVGPTPGEDVELAAAVRRLGDADALRETAEQARDALLGAEADESGGALALVAAARSQVEAAEDEALRSLAEQLQGAAAALADVGTELSSYLADLPTDSAALDGVLTRQATLKALTRKYAADADGVIAWAEQARVRLGQVDTSADAVAELAARRDGLAADLAAVAAELSGARREAAVALAEAVSAELAGLAMGRARLEVVVSPRAAAEDDAAALVVAGERVHVGPDGTDDVELRLAAHPGAVPAPIGRSASGGELSRVMLALEVVLAGADTTGTLVFDEVDAGVGGRAAVEVGRRLARLARTHQVVVVTHLPQVAAFADRHLVVDKQLSDDPAGGVTASDVRTLDHDERVVELARMLAGLDDTDTGRAHAEELLATAAADR